MKKTLYIFTLIVCFQINSVFVEAIACWYGGSSSASNPIVNTFAGQRCQSDITNYTRCADCARYELPSSNGIVQVGSILNGSNGNQTTEMYRQYPRTRVYCAEKGPQAPSQASGGQTCNSTIYNFTTNSLQNEKLKVAIGHIIKYGSTVSLIDVTPANVQARRNEYYKTSTTIHYFLNQYNNGGAVPYDDINVTLYDQAAVIYNEYNSNNIAFNVDNLVFTESSDKTKWETTINYTTSNITSISVRLKIGDCYNYNPDGGDCTVGNSYRDTYVTNDLTKKTISISIPKVDIGSEVQRNIKLEVTGTATYDEAQTYSCSGNYQPIAEETTSPNIKEKNGKISGQLPYAYVGNIEFQKQNSLGELIISDDVEVQIYTGFNCIEGNEKTKVLFKGSESMSLYAGNYSVIETEAPFGYVKDANCYNFTITPNETSDDIVITNSNSCELDFSIALDKYDKKEYTKAEFVRERIRLYQNKYQNFNGLLDFTLDSEEDASAVCSDYQQTYKNENSCLYTEQATKNSNNLDISFNENNISSYNDTIMSSGKVIGYCLTSFIFDKDVTIPSNATAGQMLLNISSDSIFAKGKLIKKCYVFDYSGGLGTQDVSSYLSGLDGNNTNFYNEYIGDITVDGIVLDFNPKSIRYTGDPTPLDINTLNNTVIRHNDLLIRYTRILNVDYYINNPISVSKITGRICSVSNNNCKFVGNGIITNFNDAIAGKGSFNFKISNDTVTNKIFNFGSENQNCEYSVDSEIIEYPANNPNGELELEFRAIDTNNPFNRDTNSNWCNGSSCESNNSVVQDYILNKNNSYNRQNTGSLYTNQTSGPKKIVLTPDLIKQIRAYTNGTDEYAGKPHAYDDYELICDKNGICKNAFLSEFNIIK